MTSHGMNNVLNEHLNFSQQDTYAIPSRDKSVKKIWWEKSHLTYFWWAIFQTGEIFFLPPGKILVDDLMAII